MSGLFVNDHEDERREKASRLRSAFAVALSLIVLLGGLGYAGHRIDGAWNNYKASKDYQGHGDKVVEVEIPQGATVSQIGSILVNNEVVKSTSGFVNAVSDAGASAKMQPGGYNLHQHIPAKQAVQEMLDSKNRIDRQFTVPEGMWVSDVLPLIAKKTGISLADLQKVAKDKDALDLPSWDTAPNSPEGFLFPDTYQYDKTPTAQEVLGAMTTEFNQVAGDLNLQTGAQQLGYTPQQVLTVASILEAEVPARYQAHVAGIIYNRLKKHMILGLDSSSHYSLKIPMNKLLPSNFRDDPSKFNTYGHQGLPPGPIDSPGKAAIQAALQPEQSDDLFWVAVNLQTGETAFAKDQAGQDANTKKFEAWCKANNNPSGCGAS